VFYLILFIQIVDSENSIRKKIVNNMSYKKLDEKIGGSTSTGIITDDNDDYDDNNNNNNNNNNIGSSIISNAFLVTAGSLSLQEQDDHQSSLSEPLTDKKNYNTNNNKRSSYENPSDPYYVFRDDLNRQLEIIDESLAEYLRLVFQTVSNCKKKTKNKKKIMSKCKKYRKSILVTYHLVFLPIHGWGVSHL
jgi:hypothetical protein